MGEVVSAKGAEAAKNEGDKGMNENYLKNQMYAQIIDSDTQLVNDVTRDLSSSVVEWNNDPASNPDFRSNTDNDQRFAKFYGGQMKGLFSDAIHEYQLTGEYKFMKDKDIQDKIKAYEKYMLTGN